MTDKALDEAIERAAPAVANLRDCQRQLDADGCEVGVSRQALNEALDAYDLLATARWKPSRGQLVEAISVHTAASLECCRAAADAILALTPSAKEPTK